MKGTVFILVLKKDGKELVILDTMNYIPMSLEKIGKSIGFPKMEAPDFKNVDNDYLSRYCLNDVNVIYYFIRDLISFLDENKLINLKRTAGGLAFGAFKHRFYKKTTPDIFIHNDKDLEALERRSYKGGITDCFKVGEFNETLFKLDINSMYPSIMRKYDLPIKQVGILRDTTDKDLKKILKKYHVIADLTIWLPQDKAYILNKIKLNGVEKSVFTWGSFDVTLSTPEIEFVLTHGKILKFKKGVVYEKANIFKGFVDFFYDKRLQYKKENKPAYDLFCKLNLNSCYGKFASKKTSYIKF
jgi:DNA polymerase elongation subunit (family B)